MTEFKTKLDNMKNELGLIQKQLCSSEENKTFATMKQQENELPDDIFEYSPGAFYRLVRESFNEEEFEQYVKLKHLTLLKTIKNCVVFFTILTVLNILAIIILLAAL